MTKDRVSRRLQTIGVALFFTLALLAPAQPSSGQPAQSATQADPRQAAPAPVPSHPAAPAIPKVVAGISMTPEGRLVFQGTGQPQDTALPEARCHDTGNRPAEGKGLHLLLDREKQGIAKQ